MSNGRGSQKLKARSATFSEEHLSPGVKITHVDARDEEIRNRKKLDTHISV